MFKIIIHYDLILWCCPFTKRGRVWYGAIAQIVLFPRTPGEHEYFTQFLRLQHDHDMLEQTTTVTMFTCWLTNTGHVQWLVCHHRAQSTHENMQAWVC